MTQSRIDKDQKDSQPARATYKTYSHVNIQKTLTPGNTKLFHHKVQVVTKPKKEHRVNYKRDTKEWICKTDDKAKPSDALFYAKTETIAQEFYRLMLPDQPKTRYWQSSPTSVHVLSQRIFGFENLHDIQQANYTDLKEIIYQQRQRFAEILVISLFLNEWDLKWGNLGIDISGRLYKIDGEFAFAELINDLEPGGNHFFNYEDINGLPNLSHYLPHHWLHLVIDLKHQAQSKFFGITLADDRIFQDALHLAIAKILILPKEFILAFIQCYDDNPRSQQMYYNFLLKRQLYLKNSAYMSENFCHYALSGKIELNYSIYKNQLEIFISMRKYNIWKNIPNISSILTLENSNLHKDIKLIKSVITKDYITFKQSIFNHTNYNVVSLNSDANTIAHIAVQYHSPDLSVLNHLCGLNINFALKNKFEEDALSLAIKHHNFNAVRFILENAIIFSQFKPNQIENALLQLFLKEKKDLCKLLLRSAERLEGFEPNQAIEPGTKQRVIHLAVLDEKPDSEMISTLTKSSKFLSEPDISNQTPLMLALKNCPTPIIIMLLDKTFEKLEWDMLKMTIEFLITHKELNYMQKLDLVDYIRNATHHQNIKERKRFAEEIIKSILDQVTSAHNIPEMIASLDATEDKSALIKPRTGCGYSSKQWHNETVSSAWIRIIVHAKERILALAKSNPEFDNDASVSSFLMSRTSTIPKFFKNPMKTADAYFELRKLQPNLVIVKHV